LTYAYFIDLTLIVGDCVGEESDFRSII